MKVTLEGKETKPENLEEGFYLYKFEGQLSDAVPRRTRKEILKIIESADRNIELTNANLPFIKIYKTGREEK